MKKIFEEIIDIIIEMIPLFLFITILIALVLTGGMSGWLNNIATWMFG